MEFENLDVRDEIDLAFYTYQTVVMNGSKIAENDTVASVYERTRRATLESYFSRQVWASILKHGSICAAFRTVALNALVAEGILHEGDLTSVNSNYEAVLRSWGSQVPLTLHLLTFTTGFTTAPAEPRPFCAITLSSAEWNILTSFVDSTLGALFESFLKLHCEPFFDVIVCAKLLDQLYCQGADAIFRDLPTLGAAMQAHTWSPFGSQCVDIYMIHPSLSLPRNTSNSSFNHLLDISALHINIQLAVEGLLLLDPPLTLPPLSLEIVITKKRPPQALSQNLKRFKSTVNRFFDRTVWTSIDFVRDVVNQRKTLLAPLLLYGPLLQLFSTDGQLSPYIPGDVVLTPFIRFDKICPALLAALLPVYVKARQNSIIIYFGSLDFLRSNMGPNPPYMETVPNHFDNGLWTIFEVKQDSISTDWLEFAIHILTRLDNSVASLQAATAAFTRLFSSMGEAFLNPALSFSQLAFVLDSDLNALRLHFNALLNNILSFSSDSAFNFPDRQFK